MVTVWKISCFYNMLLCWTMQAYLTSLQLDEWWNRKIIVERIESCTDSA